MFIPQRLLSKYCGQAIATIAALTIALPSPATDSQTLYQSGQYPQAIEQLQQSLQQTQDPKAQAIILSNLSLAYQQLGQWSNAQAAITKSLKILPNNAPALDILGHLQLTTGKPDAALESWKQSAQIYAQARDSHGLAKAQINQAQALRALGFYPRSLQALTQAAEVFSKTPDSQLKAIGLRSLGESYRVNSQLDLSQKTLQESLRIAQALNLPQEIAATQLSLANTQRVQQNSQGAIALYETIAATAPTNLLRTQAQINHLSLVLNTRAATPLKNAIADQLTKLPPTRAGIYAQINFAESLQKMPGNTKSAADVLAIAIERARGTADTRAESYGLGLLGHLYQQQNQWVNARNLTQEATQIAQQINAPEIAYRWQWQLGQILKQQGETEGAIAAYDKAITTLQTLRNDLVGVDRDVQFTFKESVEPVYREYVELLLQDSQNPRLEKARSLMEALQIAELDDFFREACINNQTVSLDNIVDRDNPNAAVIYPIVLENELQVIVKIPQEKSLRHYRIKKSRGEVEKSLGQLREWIAQPDRSNDTRRLSREVYGWLIEPIEAELKTKSSINTLVFVLDGPFRNVPMAALYDGKQYLVEKYAVALSLGLQLLDPKPLVPSGLKTLAAGLSQPSVASGFAPLPAIPSELQSIRQSGLDTTQLLNQGFTSNSLEQNLNALPYKVVHLATHGQFSSQAKDTFLLAADGPINVTQLDRFLRGRDRSNPEAIELLVLSACETASGDNRAALGLAGVAVRAGARSTMASLWQVDDRATALFIGEFYRVLAKGKVSKAEALRQAQIALLRNYPNSNFSRPSYWAAYVLVGNWL